MSYQEYVIKRNGQKEIVSFDKILKRLTNLGKGSQELKVNYTNLVKKIVDMLYDEIPTDKIDELTAQECASMITIHPDYGILASRILISNHHKKTSENYKDIVNKLYHNTDIHNERHSIISKQLFDIVMEHHEELQKMLHFSIYVSFRTDFKSD